MYTVPSLYEEGSGEKGSRDRRTCRISTSLCSHRKKDTQAPQMTSGHSFCCGLGGELFLAVFVSTKERQYLVVLGTRFVTVGGEYVK